MPAAESMKAADTKVPGTPVELENVSCPMGCVSRNDSVVVIGRDRLHRLPGEFRVVRCGVCGLLRTNPRPTAETIGYYYPSDYSPYHRPSGMRLTLRDRLAGHAHRSLNAWHVPTIDRGRLLEFGCGTGGYLRWMSSHGWEVSGVEVSDVAAQKARRLGFDVYTGTLESFPPAKKPYDLNVGWMVVEHLHEPIRALRKLADATRDDGWLAISVPNAASREFEMFDDSWFALELPRHLYHFTPQTITALLKKAGWEVRRILHQRSVDNLVASCGYLLEDRPDAGSDSWLAKQLIGFPTNVPLHFATYPVLFPIASILAVFGQTGRMTVWAQKASGPMAAD